jgi:hypothetical protein
VSEKSIPSQQGVFVKRAKRVVGTPLISPVRALATNPLCRWQEKHTMSKLQTLVQVRSHKMLSIFALLLAVLLPSGVLAQKPAITNLARLTESDGQIGSSHLGVAVAIDRDTVVVGDANAGVSDIGAAYVYVKPANGWQSMTQIAKLTSSDGAELDEFGASIAIRGDVIVVGAPSHGFFTTGKNFGAIYVFVKPAGGWTDMTETAELTASDDNSEAGYYLGRGVAIDGSGSTIFGGAPGWGATGNGALYVFVKPAGGWTSETQNAELTSSDGVGISMGGTSTTAEGNIVMTGAIDWPDAESDHCCRGAVYVWQKPANGWVDMTQTARLTASNSQPDDQLGASAILKGNTLVAGSNGAAYIFTEPVSGGWKTTSQFAAELTGSNLGPAVALGNNTIVAGAPGYLQDTGAIYIYIEPPAGWRSTSKYNLMFADPEGQALSFFGNFVAAEGGFTVVGAYLAKPTGAAYIFGPKP